MGTITKKKMIYKIARSRGIHPNEVRVVVQSLLDGIKESLVNGDRCEFRNFGVFDIVIRKAKLGRNPKQAEIAIPIPEHKAVKFSPGKTLKTIVRKG